MLNKINTLLASTSTTMIKEFKTTLYTLGAGSTGTTLTLPSGITEGSLGFFLIGATQTGSGSIIELGVPSGFTLIIKREGVNGGTAKGGSNGLFYKYMTAADSGTTISTIFVSNNTDQSEAVFVEVILNRSAKTRGFGYLSDVAASAGGNTVTLSDIPSIIPNNDPFFILAISTDSDGGITDTFSGGMELYDTSFTTLNDTSRTKTRLFRYDNVKIQDLPDTADFVHTSSASAFGSQGDHIIWLK